MFQILPKDRIEFHFRDFYRLVNREIPDLGDSLDLGCS
jgi:hypothetical protein